MPEPIVQVPVSLLKGIRDALAEHDDPHCEVDNYASDQAYISHVDALLSQPIPTAEPPRIEDMAPGTTFTEEVRWTVTGTLSTGSTVVHSRSGEMRFADRFDLSTIRDVTPPKDTA